MKLGKKGFTLIELLAVIVILTVIMMISMPTILGVIDDAKKGAAKNSALGYLDALEREIVAAQVRGDDNSYFDDNNSFDLSAAIAANVEVRGEDPDELSLTIEKGKIISGTIRFGDYTFEVQKNGNVVEVTTTASAS